MSPPSPTFPFPDFTFPSLNSSASSTQSQSPPSVALEKDEHGFYKEVVSSLFHGTVSSSQQHVLRLAPFLPDPPHRRRLLSKTRTIVDGLRISGEHAAKSKSAGRRFSPDPSDSVSHDDHIKPRLSVSEDGGDSRSVLASDLEEDDGWIRSEMSEAGSETKSQRTRDLHWALGRNRTGAGAGKEKGGEKDDDIDLGYQFLNEQSAIYSQRSASPAIVDPEVTYNDGWIEGRSSASRPRKFQAGHLILGNPLPSLSPQTAVIPPKPQARFAATPFVPMPVALQPNPYFPVPVMYPAYAHPYAATGYMQMQMHIQSQLQLQMQMQAQAHQPWFPHVAYPVPLVPTGFPNSHANHLPMAGPDRPVVTGVSGMRHA
jgi:hypothetical protein